MDYKTELSNFKSWIKAIADKNNDELKVTVWLDGNGYNISVVETADGHVLASALGETVQEVISILKRDIPEALESWGYENVSYQ